MAFTTDQNKTSRLCTMAENTPTCQNTLFNMYTSKQNETNQRIEAKRKIEAVAKIKIQIISYYNYM